MILLTPNIQGPLFFFSLHGEVFRIFRKTRESVEGLGLKVCQAQAIGPASKNHLLEMELRAQKENRKALCRVRLAILLGECSWWGSFFEIRRGIVLSLVPLEGLYCFFRH